MTGTTAMVILLVTFCIVPGSMRPRVEFRLESEGTMNPDKT